MRISDIFGLGDPGADWCREQRDAAQRAGAEIDEMDCSVGDTHYSDPRSPNAARWS